MLKIYCDSSFDDKRKIAGIGIIIERDGVIKKPISTFIPAYTNNEAELYAIYLSSILSGGEKAIIYSDSMTALDYVNGKREFLSKEGWNNQQYNNHQRMRFLAYKTRKVSNKLDFMWIKAHTRHMKINPMFNQLADTYAKLGRGKFYEK